MTRTVIRVAGRVHRRIVVGWTSRGTCCSSGSDPVRLIKKICSRVVGPRLWAGGLDKIMATRRRHSPEQVVRKLMTADRLLAEGNDTAAVCRELGVSEATYHRWRNQFGGLKAEDAKRLKDLERENSTLKRLLADAELEKAALKEIARGNF
jgi:putative transposase